LIQRFAGARLPEMVLQKEKGTVLKEAMARIEEGHDSEARWLWWVKALGMPDVGDHNMWGDVYEKFLEKLPELTRLGLSVTSECASDFCPNQLITKEKGWRLSKSVETG
ncbi:hypothetical protein BGZ65_002411, partial [Modicella reniformis]